VYFSPTGTTQKTVLAIAEGTGIPFREIDLALPGTRRTFQHEFSEFDLVVAGLPVYAGRLPMYLDDFFTGLNGNATPAVAVVLYGNREYNDALIELKIRLQERGFRVSSAAAFIGEHTVSAKIATGRPDANDLAIARDFGRRNAESIRGGVSGELELKGNYPFTWKGFDPQNPGDFPPRPRLVTDESRTQCRLCSRNCPWAAINPDDSRIRDYSKCMFCYRCLKNCPSKAIQVTNDKFLAYLPQFEKMLSQRREPELFF
jgi:flavodoxin/NAD-dependent dihydropyrimidine dehydrogenase PreA subunit